MGTERFSGSLLWNFSAVKVGSWTNWTVSLYSVLRNLKGRALTSSFCGWPFSLHIYIYSVIIVESAFIDFIMLPNFKFWEVKGMRKKNYIFLMRYLISMQKGIKSVLESRTFEAGCPDIKISEKMHVIFNDCWFYCTRFPGKRTLIISASFSSPQVYPLGTIIL